VLRSAMKEKKGKEKEREGNRRED